MTVRRFGPVLGAGVQVTEAESEQQITPAPLGVTVFVGEYQKGVVGEPGYPAGKLDYVKRYGARRLRGSEAPGCVQDFYRLGEGAGEVIPYRVTAGDEVKARLDLYTRQGIAASPSSGRALLGYLLAKSGGVWGGQRKTYVDDISGAGDLTATTLDTGDAMVTNEWAGGTLQLKKVGSKSYRILGNTAAGVISVAGDQTLLADWNAGTGTPTNRYVLARANSDYLGAKQALSAGILDGTQNPGTEFGIRIFEDGVRVKEWSDLSADPTKANYWVTVINDDASNHYVSAVDVYTGDKTTAAVRPANFFGVSKSLTSTVLTLPDPDATVSSTGGANPTVVASLGSNAQRQTLTGTVQNSGADISWATSLGPLTVVQAGFDGVATDLGPEAGTVTVTNGGTVLADGDTIVVELLPLKTNELTGGRVYPDAQNKPNLALQILSNSANSVTVRTGLDLTNGGTISAGAQFRLSYAEEFSGGHNGSPVTDADYLSAFDAASSTLNKIFGKNKGLVKLATPGVTSAAVTKAGLAYAEARNYLYQVEIPDSVTEEADAVDWINSTIGRSDYGFTYFPSFGYVLDPDAQVGARDVPLRKVSLSGMILGRHAREARNFDGYHKAPAGTSVTLPDVLKLTTGTAETAAELNEEILNPQGINVIKFKDGNVIVWGDRTISPTFAWKFLHQRTLMSHYEHVLMENFDWIVYSINDYVAQQRVGTTLRAFFLPEWIKRAIRGKKFDDAFGLKIDAENNTLATMSQGDLNAEITLRLADTVERFKIIISKAGIFDAVA